MVLIDNLYQFDKCLLQIVEVRKKEEGRRKKEEGRRKKEEEENI
ncbi:hypothetical protein [Okeania sp. KiyG1]|nr:hypothetical protein [Okeania sp. KiyG1]